jgi:hypothetical protein
MYMEQSPGFTKGDSRGKVYRLVKSVYEANFAQDSA